LHRYWQYNNQAQDANALFSTHNSCARSPKFAELHTWASRGGILQSATVFKFEITNNERKLKSKIIYVTIKCPEGLGDGFLCKGQLYDLHLTDDTSGLRWFSIFDQFNSKGQTQ